MSEEERIQVGIRLQELRQRAGMSREAMALESGISFATIRSWESGTKELRLYNLEKYLKAFTPIGCIIQPENCTIHRGDCSLSPTGCPPKPEGCHNTIDWILYGNSPPPKLIGFNKDNTMNVSKMVELLSMTSNLFYYIDDEERVLHIKQSWLQYLNNDRDELQEPILGSSLRTLCSKEVYEVCHKNYLKCLSGQAVYFSYTLSGEFSQSHTEVKMLYSPVTRAKDNKVSGIFAFLSSSRG